MIEEFNRISIFGATKQGDRIWFCNQLNGTLMYIDIMSNTIKYEAMVPGEKRICEYGPLVYCDERIYMAPLNAKNIVIYDIKEKKFSIVQLNMDEYAPRKTHNLFFDVKAIGEFIYFFPGRFRAIVRMRKNSFDVEYIDCWYEAIKNKIINSDRLLFSFCNDYYDNVFYLPFWQGNIVIAINLENKAQYSVLNIKTDKQLSGLCIEDKNDGMWISQRGSNELLLVSRSGEIKQRELVLWDEERKEGIQYIKSYRNRICTFLFSNQQSIRWSLDNNEHNVIYSTNQENSGIYVIGNEAYKYETMLDENTLFAFSNRDGSIILYSLDKNKILVIPGIIQDSKEVSIIRNKTMNVNHVGIQRVRKETIDEGLPCFICSLRGE